MRAPMRRAAAVAVALAVVAGLSGCSLAEGLVNQGIQEVTGGEGEVSFGTIPEDFPDAVPVPDGQVLLSAKPTPESWAVTILVSDQAAAQAAADAVEAAGFVPLADGTTVYENDTHHVVVSWTDVEGGVGVAFVVSTR